MKTEPTDISTQKSMEGMKTDLGLLSLPNFVSFSG